MHHSLTVNEHLAGLWVHYRISIIHILWFVALHPSSHLLDVDPGPVDLTEEC